ncbi:MAG: ribosome-associated translation inhibitor RaiA [Candidatus Margulisiibacteriota bacterium]
MQIVLSGHGIEVTESIRLYVHEKIGKLEEFFHNIQKVEVILDLRANADPEKRNVVEIRAWLAGNKVVQALEAAVDMYAAFDLVLEEAKHQVQKHKEKHLKEDRKLAGEFKRKMKEAGEEFIAPDSL